MIDIHTHCLPKIDDGAKDVVQSLEMLAESYRQGVRKIVATPHCIVHKQERIENFLTKRQESVSVLQKHIAEDIPDMLFGAEVYLDNDIAAYDNIHKLCISGTSYMLIELAENLSAEKTADILYRLILKGITPIIAHIDRYPQWKEYVSAFLALKVIYQINASNFLTFKGRTFIKYFIKNKYPIVIGSDMHNMDTRPCNMGKAYEKAKAKFGDDADIMFKHNLDNENFFGNY